MKHDLGTILGKSIYSYNAIKFFKLPKVFYRRSRHHIKFYEIATLTCLALSCKGLHFYFKQNTLRFEA